MTKLTLTLIALLLVNLATFVQFGADKRRAVAGVRRIAEKDLLTLAFLGGTPAAYAARQVYRHKTRKQPFSNRLAVIAMLQVGVATGLAIAMI